MHPEESSSETSAFSLLDELALELALSSRSANTLDSDIFGSRYGADHELSAKLVFERVDSQIETWVGSRNGDRHQEMHTNVSRLSAFTTNNKYFESPVSQGLNHEGSFDSYRTRGMVLFTKPGSRNDDESRDKCYPVIHRLKVHRLENKSFLNTDGDEVHRGASATFPGREPVAAKVHENTTGWAPAPNPEYSRNVVHGHPSTNAVISWSSSVLHKMEIVSPGYLW